MRHFRAAVPGGLTAILFLWLSVAHQAAAQETLSAQAVSQLNALLQEKASWSETERKMDSTLIRASKQRLGRNFAAGIPQMRSQVQVDDGDRVHVDMKAMVSQSVLDLIVQSGGEVENSFAQFDAIRAWLPVASLETVASHPDVRSIREADQPITNKINTSEGDTAHRADEVRTDFGVDGTGVTVGVLSDSVEALNMLKASGDIPTSASVLPGQAGSGSSEGTAMMEIVFDLAPGAGQIFATAFGGQASFASNILALQAQGCQVIVDDVFYPAEPVFQDGIIAQAVETVAANGVSYFSSAGNSGNLNDGTAGVFEGDFNGVVVSDPNFGTVTVHEYSTNVVSNVISGGNPFVFTLHWADPVGGSSNDYDFALLNPSLTTVIDGSFAIQDGDDDPFEAIGSIGAGDIGNRLVVVLFSGADRFFHLNTVRGQLQFATDGQTAGHSTTDNSFGIAAVDITQAPGPDGSHFDGSEPVEFFSSDGPRRVFFDADGNPFTPGNFSSTGGVVRQKPDFTAADGVMTATPGFNPFFGTSAAAPHAAGLAALMIDHGVFTTPANIRTAFSSTAIDIEDMGMDRDSGYGIIDLKEALNVSCDYTLTPPSIIVPATGVVGGVFTVATSGVCPWTALSNATFITITSAQTGVGTSAIQYTVAPNFGTGRVGTISLGGELFTVTQQSCALPAAVTNPMSQAGCPGGNVTFNAAGSGTLPLNIQWQVNQGPGFMDIPGATGPSLTVNNVTLGMNGYQYQAVFFNGCGDAATVPAVLTVGAPGPAGQVQASDGLFPDRVRVQWAAAAGATSYRVFRSENSNGSGATDISGMITTTQFDDFTATTEMTSGCDPKEVAIAYYYYVLATNPCGQSVASALNKGSIADPAKLNASLHPDRLGDMGLLVLTLAAMYAYQRRQKRRAHQPQI